MENDEDLIRKHLVAATRQVDAFHVSAMEIEPRIARKRRIQVGLTVAVSAAVLTAGTAAVWSTQRTSPTNGGVTGLAAQNTSSPTLGPPVGTRSFACGQPIASPKLLRASMQGFRLSISKVIRSHQDIPEVSAMISSSATAVIGLPTQPTPLRLLVIRDGVIVAGQDVPLQAHPLAGIARAVTIDRSHPYLQNLQPISPEPCPSVHWQDLWVAGSRYRLAIVASADLKATGQGDHINDWRENPLLIAEVSTQ